MHRILKMMRKISQKQKIIICAIFAAVIVAISFLFDALAQSFTHLLKNSVFDIIFGWITNFGSVFVVLIVMTSLFLWEKKKREWIPTLWVSYVAAIILVSVLKLLIARERPIETEFFPIIDMLNIYLLNYAFPSMHAAAAFAAIPILDREYPTLKKFWIIFAVLVAFSRLYFDKHYLSDVLAGGFIGFGIGAFFVWLEQKTKVFKKLMGMIGYG